MKFKKGDKVIVVGKVSRGNLHFDGELWTGEVVKFDTPAEPPILICFDKVREGFHYGNDGIERENMKYYWVYDKNLLKNTPENIIKVEQEIVEKSI